MTPNTKFHWRCKIKGKLFVRRFCPLWNSAIRTRCVITKNSSLFNLNNRYVRISMYKFINVNVGRLWIHIYSTSNNKISFSLTRLFNHLQSTDPNKIEKSCANLTATKKTRKMFWDSKQIIHSRYFYMPCDNVFTYWSNNCFSSGRK